MEELKNNTLILVKKETNVPLHSNLSSLFEEQAILRPNHTALIFDNLSLTYSELNEKANQLAHYLRNFSGNKKIKIALCMQPSFDLLIAILGIIKAGSTYIPLDPDNPVSRIKYILEDTKADVLLTQSAELQLFSEVNVHKWCFDKQRSELTAYPVCNPQPINEPDDLAYIIYTSGSTGTPKGVMITHSNVLYFIHWFSKALEVCAADIFDFSSSVSFDFAVATTLFPMMQGAQIVICPPQTKKDPYLYMNHLARHHVTVAKLTPAHFRNLKEAVLHEKKYLNLRYIVFGGDSLFRKDIEEWLNHFPRHVMFCEYGPTEATVATSWLKVDSSTINQFHDKIPIGWPALNTQLYILDDNLHPVPCGEIAELYIGGKGVAKGYLNRKESTEKSFIKDPFSDNPADRLYKTGDFCRFLANGAIEFVERKDNQVKIRGFRVQTEEIEACFMAYPGIREVAVIARDPNTFSTTEKQLIAYYVPHHAQEVDENELRVYLRAHLPEYMVPVFFVMLQTLPLSANGKIDRQKLPEFPSVTTNDEPFTGSDMERRLKSIWEQGLNITNIRVDDNFFDLGGNSLLAARILTKIRNGLKKDILLKDLYNFPTIMSLALRIEQADSFTSAGERVLSAASKNQIIPLSELQFLFWLMRTFYPNAKILNVIDRKRLKGSLDIKCLNVALSWVCKNDPILGYRIRRFAPIQHVQKLPEPQIEEISLQGLSVAQQEAQLARSLDFMHHYSWKSKGYLFKLRLFRLDEHLYELHLAMSHLISDELSTDVFFNSLSHYYNLSLHHKEIALYSDRVQFKDYVLNSIEKNQHELQKNQEFWESYLQDIPYLYFPDEFVLKKGRALNTCSFNISEEMLEQLKRCSSHYGLAITDSLTAAVSRALKSYISENKNQLIAINLVKSTRDDEEYDSAIGLFVRSDILKINLAHSTDLLELSREVQRAIAQTAAHQSCPVIVKLGCLLKKGWCNRPISTKLMGFFATIYSRLFARYRLDYRILNMFFRVFLASKADSFFVNVNIMNHFIGPKRNSPLFSLDSIPTKTHELERQVDKNILNIGFERDNENNAHLTLCGNFTHSFLERLGQDVVEAVSQFKL